VNYLFSVIIPIYNSDKYLRKCIDSVINQKKNNVEIVLVNDCSTDNSGKICNYYKKKYSFVKLINHKKNLGVGPSRNKAIKVSTGEYLVFLDSDDNLYSNSLNGLEKFIKKKLKPEVIVVRFKKTIFPRSNFKLIKDNSKNYKKTEKLINYINKTKFPANDCWMYVVKKSFCSSKKIDFPNIRFAENEIFVAKILCLMKKYACFSGNFLYKNDRDFSLNHSKDLGTTISTLKSVIELNFFSRRKSLSKTKKKFINSYLQDDFGTFSALLILRKKEEIRKVSNFLEKNKQYIKNLVKKPENVDLTSLIKKGGTLKALLNFRKLIIKNKIDLIKGLNFDFKNLYIYCRGKYAEATIKALRETGYNIKGIIDDNNIFTKNSFLNYRPINSVSFFKKNSNSLSKTAVIITNQKDNTLKKISLYLRRNNIKKNQIVMIKY